MKQSNKINFKGQNIYIGIDVHLKSWHITIMTDFGFKRKHSQPASASMLIEHLRNNYPEGNYVFIVLVISTERTTRDCMLLMACSH